MTNTRSDKKDDSTKNLPRRFDGNRNKYRAFMDAVELFFITETKYDTPDKKIALVLGLLDDGEARTWRTNFLRNARGTDGTLKLGTYADLVKKLDATFKRANEQDEALFTLHQMRQRSNETAEEAVTRFCEQAALAGVDLTTNGRLAIDYLKAVLNERLVEKISLDINEPSEDFEDWVKLAIRYDNRWNRNKFLRNGFRRNNGGNRNLRPLPKINRRDPDAMDIDALTTEERDRLARIGACFRCKEKGHMANDCPTKNRTGASKNQTDSRPQKKSPKEMGRHIHNLCAQYLPKEVDEIYSAFEQEEATAESTTSKEDF